MKIKSVFPRVKLIIIIIVVGIISCTEQQSNVKLPEIDLSDDTFLDKSILLSEIADSITYIRLETNDQSLISSIDQIVFSENFIIVLDSRTNRLLLFRREGSFIKQLGRKGKGPGEFIRIDHFYFSSNEKHIFILADNRITKYSIDGDFIKTISLPDNIYPSYFYPSANNSFLLIQNYPNTILTDNYSLFQVASDGRVLKRKLKINVRKPSIYDYGGPLTHFYDSGTVYYWSYLIDTVFSINSDLELEPIFSLRYGSKNISESVTRFDTEDREAMGNGYLITSMIVSKRIIFFNGLNNLSRLAGVYYIDDRTHYNVIYNLDIIDNGFINDIDGTIPFWPSGNVNGNQLYAIVESASISSMRRNEFQKQFGYKSAESRHFVDSLLGESNLLLDNPWIMIVNLK